MTPIQKTDLLQGTLDMLILKIVGWLLARFMDTGSRSGLSKSPRKF
jgi:hypothetical protein